MLANADVALIGVIEILFEIGLEADPCSFHARYRPIERDSILDNEAAQIDLFGRRPRPDM